MPIVRIVNSNNSATNMSPPSPALRPIISISEASNNIAVYHCIIYKVIPKNRRDNKNHSTTIAILVIMKGVLIRK